MELEDRKGTFDPDPRLTIKASNFSPTDPENVRVNEKEWNLQRWLRYGLEALDIVQQTGEGKFKPSWEHVWFRNESEFMAGSFSFYPQIWLILINRMEKHLRAEIYHSVFEGVNLFDNLMVVNPSQPACYKNVKYATYFVENTDNTKKGCPRHHVTKGLEKGEATYYPRRVLAP